MGQDFLNVAEPWPLYDTVIVCKTLYGKEKAINGWYTSFRDFAADTKHTFFKSRTAGTANLAYCNMDSADQVDFVYKAYSIGVRFFAPVMPDGRNEIIISPANLMENMNVFWLFDLAKHVGMDFRVQQDVIVENTCIASPPGYGPRGGGGAMPMGDDTVPFANQQPWKLTTGTNGEPCIDNRFAFPNPIEIPRNTPIEINLYVSQYARYILNNLWGPTDNIYIDQEQDDQPKVDDNYVTIPTRYGIQVSLFGYREVQQRGQYHAAGAVG